MQRHDGFSDSAEDWTFVSRKSPCPLCGGDNHCRRDLKGQFACCTRISSEWPLSVGGWVHDLEKEAAVIGATAGAGSHSPSLGALP